MESRKASSIHHCSQMYLHTLKDLQSWQTLCSPCFLDPLQGGLSRCGIVCVRLTMAIRKRRRLTRATEPCPAQDLASRHPVAGEKSETHQGAPRGIGPTSLRGVKRNDMSSKISLRVCMWIHIYIYREREIVCALSGPPPRPGLSCFFPLYCLVLHLRLGNADL